MNSIFIKSNFTYNFLTVHNESSDLTREYLNDNSMMEVESGIEALEDTIDDFGSIHNIDTQFQDSNPVETEQVQKPLTTSNFGLPPSRSNLKTNNKTEDPKQYFFNFPMYLLTFLVFANYFLFPNSNNWNGFLLGLWAFCFSSNLKSYILDTFFTDSDQKPTILQMRRSSAIPPTYTIPVVKEHRPLKKHEVTKLFYKYFIA